MFPFATWTRDSVDDFEFLIKLMQDYICDLPNRDLATLKELKVVSQATKSIDLTIRCRQHRWKSGTEQILNSYLPH